MTQDEIMELAEQADLADKYGTINYEYGYRDEIIAFAKLVEAKLREKIKHFLVATSVSVQTRVYIGDEEISMLKMTHEEIHSKG